MKVRARDPENGFGKEMKKNPIWRTVAYWGIVNHWCEKVRRVQWAHKSIRLRYEDYTAQPRETLDGLKDVTGLDYTSTVEGLANGRALRLDHTAAGNYVRMSDQIRLRRDIEWENRMSGFQKQLCWQLGGRMAARYGYGWHPNNCERQSLAELDGVPVRR